MLKLGIVIQDVQFICIKTGQIYDRVTSSWSL